MKKTSISTLASVCIIGLGGMMLWGWLAHPPVMVELFSGYGILAAAVCFFLLGLILLWLPKPKNKFKTTDFLLQDEHPFRAAFDFSAVGVALISPKGTCLKVNKALCNIVGFSENELLTLDLRKIIHAEDLKKDLPYIREMLNGKIKTYQAEQRYFHKNGEIVWLMMNVSLITDDAGDALYFIVQLQDISAEKKAAEQLQDMAYHDPLTGLANRNKLEQRVNQLIVLSQRQHAKFALIFLDLDHFKNINDTIGHDAGDILLQVVAERLKNTVRVSDLVARLGGDEFVVVIADVKNTETIVLIAQKILDNLLKPITIKGHELYITTSIGISFYPFDGHDIQTLMKNADLALYRAKDQGRNNYQFCTPEMTAQAQEKMARQNALSHALVKEEFLLYYQPKFNLVTGNICGLEALLRWRSSDYGMVSPAEVILLAEETGLIVPLSEWVLRTACKQVRSWQDKGKMALTLSINLSPRQFKQTNFVESILRILDETDFSPQCLELEITESLIMQDPENTQRILRKLKDHGIKIAIDNFGTGYSSLSYLRRFSIDKIKIDKAFVQSITTDETNMTVVTAMIAMANKLKIGTVAEGVEKEEQYNFLLREGCSEAQGYYLSQPLPVDLMTEFLMHPVVVKHDR